MAKGRRQLAISVAGPDHRPAKRIVWLVPGLILAIVAALCSATLLAHQASAAAGDAFDPSVPQVFLSQAPPGSVTGIYTDLYTGTESANGSVTLSPTGAVTDFDNDPLDDIKRANYNALGYDPTNNYLYSVVRQVDTATSDIAANVHDLFKIGQQDAITDLGPITGLPAAEDIDEGTFGPDGTMYIGSSTDSHTMYAVNVATRVATPIPLTGLGSLTGPGSDFTYANGYLWAIQGNGTTNYMVRIDPATGAVTLLDITSLAIPLTANFGAAWTFGNGNLGFEDNNSGTIYQISAINPATTTPAFSVVATGSGPVSGWNDGASTPAQPVDLGITKTAAPTFTPGSPLSYTITVTNHGPGISSGWTVTDAVPSGLAAVTATSSTSTCKVSGNAVTCAGGQLAANAADLITVTGTPSATTACVTNTATVLGNESDPTSSNNSASAMSCPQQLPSLTLSKTALPTTIKAAGDLITYSYLVTNTGNVPLNSITINETGFSGTGAAPVVTCAGSPVSLAAAATVICTATYHATQADIDAGKIINTATATGTPSTGSAITSPSSTATVTVAQGAALTLLKSAAPTKITSAGDVVAYSYLVTNTGNVTLTGTAIQESAFTGKGTAPVVACPAAAATLAPGASVTCTATYKSVQADIDAGSISNTATATASSTSGTTITSPPSSATVTAGATSTLTLSKTASPTTVKAVGDVITYSFLVTNTGNVTLTKVTIIDTKFSGTGPKPQVSCPAAAASLAPGASITCTATYTATAADITAGKITNTATACADPATGPPITSAPSTATVSVTPTVNPTGTATGSPTVSPTGTATGSPTVSPTGTTTGTTTSTSSASASATTSAALAFTQDPATSSLAFTGVEVEQQLLLVLGLLLLGAGAMIVGSRRRRS